MHLDDAEEGCHALLAQEFTREEQPLGQNSCYCRGDQHRYSFDSSSSHLLHESDRFSDDCKDHFFETGTTDRVPPIGNALNIMPDAVAMLAEGIGHQTLFLPFPESTSPLLRNAARERIVLLLATGLQSPLPACEPGELLLVEVVITAFGSEDEDVARQGVASHWIQVATSLWLFILCGHLLL